MLFNCIYIDSTIVLGLHVHFTVLSNSIDTVSTMRNFKEWPEYTHVYCEKTHTNIDGKIKNSWYLFFQMKEKGKELYDENIHYSLMLTMKKK